MHSLLPELQDKEHIIWDWNGTLLADLTHNVRTMNVLLASANLPLITTGEHRNHFKFPVIEYYKTLGFDTSPEHFYELCEIFNARYNEGIADCMLVEGARDILLTLQSCNKTQSILSATKQDVLASALERFGLSDFFTHIYGIDNNFADSKLDRGRQLLKLSGIPSSATILVGDTDHDLEVGTALGIDVVLVDHGHQSFERLIATHDRVVQCFAVNSTIE